MDMKRRTFIGRLAAAGSGAVVLKAANTPGQVSRPIPDLAITPASELAASLSAGSLSCRQLTDAYLRRIAAQDRNGAGIHSVLALNPAATKDAQVLDVERNSGASRGPLHGLPLLLKDNLDTADPMPTTAGSLALAGTIAPHDAYLVGRLRGGGALFLGKANLSEWANIRSSQSSSGWSALGGQTLNPYALNRSPSGSSSGSAAAVAAGLCAAAIGTETDGSIVSPASACSLVGLKPTVGLVSRSGIIPISASQDTAGPMARSVRDAALLLGVMAGNDPSDPATAAGEGHRQTDYTASLDRNALRGARLGVVRSWFGTHPAVDVLIEHHLERLRDLGAVLVDPVSIPTLHQFGGAEFEVLLYELKAGLASYLATRGDSVRVHSLADIIAFNDRHRDREFPYFGQETFLQAERKGPLSDLTYREARERCIRLARVEGLEAALSAHRLDALIGPTSGLPWLIDPVNGDQGTGGCSSLAAVAGTPHLTVPAGYVRGLPVGLSFMGPAWSEPALLAYGFAFEQATHAWRPPRFLRTAEGEV
jgi:amidase